MKGIETIPATDGYAIFRNADDEEVHFVGFVVDEQLAYQIAGLRDADGRDMFNAPVVTLATPAVGSRSL
jgi:hypothetical protein